MASWCFPRMKMTALVAAVCLSGLALAGCDDHVQISRDPDIHIAKGMTWAWQPEPDSAAMYSRDNRRVTRATPWPAIKPQSATTTRRTTSFVTA